MLDPFCGSGTVLVESFMAERNSIGVDINNLALLLAKVKTTPLPREEILQTLRSILQLSEEKAKRQLGSFQKATIERIPNLYHWFQPYVAEHLSVLKDEISTITDSKVQDFFKVCFSATMYKTSNIRKADNPYFIRILHKDELAEHKPHVFEQFARIVKRNAKALETISKAKNENVWVNIYRTTTKQLESQIGKEKANLIVTSPPYGEEKNTMDYARFSKLALYWLGLDGQQVKEMKSNALGAELRQWNNDEVPSATLRDKLKEIALRNEKRANEVYSFFYDYTDCLKAMYEVLKWDGYCCIVIGDRTASGVAVPNGKITSELCESVGFTLTERLERRMYMRALRSNIICSENILIMKKE